jgi:cytochrome b561
MGKLFEVDPDEGGLFGWHTALGLTVLALMLIRVGWRLTHQVPAPPPGSPAWQNAAARFVHGAFYVLMLVLPLSGWLLTTLEGDAVTYFGWFAVPALPVSGLDEDFVEETHEVLGNVLLVLAAVHVLAGLKHQFVDRDGVLGRMLAG